MKIELSLTYINNNFGKPNRHGEWGLRSDQKKYTLYIDKVPVINISIEYERFDTSKPNYSCAYILYDNLFFSENNSKYNNKGYATIALENITEALLREGNVPRISLNILPNNKASQKVAEKVGFIHIRNDEYSIFNPHAIKMYEEGLSYLKGYDDEIYNLQLKKFIQDFKKYIDSISIPPQTKTSKL